MKTHPFRRLPAPLLFLLAALLFLTFIKNAHADLTNGLVAWWSFSGEMLDHSGNGHDSTPQGTTFIADRFNRPGMACAFNGTTDYIQVAAPSTLQMTQEISIVAWINFSGGGSWNPRFLSYAGSIPADVQGYEFLTLGNGPSRRLMFIFGNQSMTSSNSIPENTWHFVAAVANSNSLAIYIDGRLDSTMDATPEGFRYGDSPMFIGNKAPGSITFGDDIWGGAIDDLRIFNRTLAPEEIHQFFAHDTAPTLNISRTPSPAMLRLHFSHLITGMTYQVQFSTDLKSWTIFGLPFQASATSSIQDLPPETQYRFWKLISEEK